MTIEVRQLRINASVGQTDNSASQPDKPCDDQEQMKVEILDECKQMLKELLREGERR